MADQTYYKQYNGLFEYNISNFNCKHNLYDSFDGSLNLIQHQIDFNQYNFLYLYADWCARSIRYKELIENLTCTFSNEVYF